MQKYFRWLNYCSFIGTMSNKVVLKNTVTKAIFYRILANLGYLTHNKKHFLTWHLLTRSLWHKSCWKWIICSLQTHLPEIGKSHKGNQTNLFFLLLTFFCSSEPPLLTSTEVRWSATSCSERELNLSSPSPDLATEPLMMIKAKARAVNQINHPGSPLTLSRLQTV